MSDETRTNLLRLGRPTGGGCGCGGACGGHGGHGHGVVDKTQVRLTPDGAEFVRQGSTTQDDA